MTLKPLEKSFLDLKNDEDIDFDMQLLSKPKLDSLTLYFDKEEEFEKFNKHCESYENVKCTKKILFTSATTNVNYKIER